MQIKKEKKLIFDRNKSCTFLVGAGISMESPSDLASAMVFVKDILKLCCPDEELVYFLDNLSRLRYELIVELCQLHIDSDLHFLDYLSLNNRPNIIHNFLAQSLLEKHIVLTTNFDYLIEHALHSIASIEQLNNIISIITKEDYIKNNNPLAMVEKGNILLYKIHGSKQNYFTGENTQQSLVTTISALGKDREKGKTFSLETYKYQSIQEIIQNRILVVMGYSGNDDFDISPFLQEIAEYSELYWIEHSEIDTIKIEEVKFSDIIEQGAPQADKILFKLAQDKTKRIVKIQTHTRRFIEEVMIPQILTVEIKEKSKPSEKNISFIDWLREQTPYKDVKIFKKYQFASLLYSYLGNIDKALQCSKKSFNTIDELDIQHKIELLTQIGELFRIQGDYSHAMDKYNLAFKFAEDSDNVILKTTLLNNMGIIYMNQGNTDEAYKMFSQAQHFANSSPNSELLCPILGNIGLLFRAMGKFEESSKSFNLALTIAENKGNLPWKSIYINNLGLLSQDIGDFKQAKSYFLQALEITEHLVDIETKVTILSNLGEISRNLGSLDDAITYEQEALALAENMNLNTQKALIHNNLGLVFQSKGDYEFALKEFTTASSIAKEVGDFNNQSIYLQNIGIIHQNNGNYDQALHIYHEALKIAEDVKNPAQQAIVYGNIGVIFLLIGKNYDAFSTLSKAIEIEELQGGSLHLATHRLNLSRYYQNTEQWDKSIENLEISIKLANEMGNLNIKATALNQLFEIYQLQNNTSKIIDINMELLKIAECQQDILGQAILLSRLGNIYQIMGDYKKALNIFKPALQYTEILQDDQGCLVINNNLGIITTELHDYETSIKYFAKASDYAEKIGDIPSLANIQLNLAFNFKDKMNLPEKAKEHLINAIKLFKKLENNEQAENLRAILENIP